MEEYYLNECLKEAKKASNKEEVPVGALILKDGKIIARAHNNRHATKNVLGHAEVLCILKASKKLKDWRLDTCEMLVNLEPCELCKKIINESRIKKVYYLTNKKDAVYYKQTQYVSLEHQHSSFAKKSKENLSSFFQKRR